jgi:hypothetical protein
MNGVNCPDYFNDFQKNLNYLSAAGRKVSVEIQMDILLSNCNQKFYKEPILKFRRLAEDHADGKRSLENSIIQQLKKEMMFLYNHASHEEKEPKSANKSVLGKKDLKFRFCQRCFDEKRATYATHDTEYCRLNKGNSKYSSLILDSGATHNFFKDQPGQEYRAHSGQVSTANGKSAKIIGIGKVSLGELQFNPVFHVPEFNDNLVSGIQLMKNGYKIVTENDKTVILKKGKIVASATFNPTKQLMVFDEFPTIANQATLHERLGHLNDKIIEQTVNATTGLEHGNCKSDCLCETCVITKSRHENINKKSTTKREPLEVIEMDIQGPFPVRGHDGTVYNLKMVDVSTGYIKLENLKNKSAESVLESFKRYLARMERRTGNRVKYVRTDQGSEFDGVFLAYLEEMGITKMKGIAYDHHFPGHAERSHQTIANMAKAMLFDSKLERTYYSEALQTAVYLLNRTAHGDRTVTPFELMFGRKPNLAHLHKFGSICYAFIPCEKRDKLDNTAEKCRMIGYGDDDDTEEIKGYKVLCERDRAIIWSNSVRFDEDAEITPLNHIDNNTSEATSSLPVSGVSITVLPADESRNSTSPTGNMTESTDFEPEVQSDNESFYSTEEGDDMPEEAPSTPTESEPYPAELSNNITRRRSQRIANQNRELFWVEHQNSEDSGEEVMMAFVSTFDGTPETYEDVLNSPDKDEWMAAMEREMKSITNAQTWTLTDLPEGRKPVKCRWVFRKKYDSKGNVTKYKARLVAKGFTQKHGLDYFETYAPVAKLKSIRAICAIAAAEGFEIYQNDVPTAFLLGDLEEEIYMEQPDGFKLQNGKVCKLQKTLYGLKQSPREFNKLIHRYLLSQGFTQSLADPCVYRKGSGTNLIIVGVYVDDMTMAGNGNKFKSFMKDFEARFNMDTSTPLEWCLGIHFQWNSDGSLTLSQSQFIQQKLDMFKRHIGPGIVSTPLPMNVQEILRDCETSKERDRSFPYRSMVGAVMYSMIGTRPDLAHALSVVSRHQEDPKIGHCNLVRHIYKYLRGNDRGLLFKPSKGPIELIGYADAAYANNEKAKSTSGYLMEINDCLVSWNSHAQPIVALSSTEAELISAVSACQEIIWFKQLLSDLTYPQGTVVLMEDNEACIKLSKYPSQNHKRTKHFDVRYYWIREAIERGDFNLEYCPTKSQLADILTKTLPRSQNNAQCKKLGLVQQQGRQLKNV